jgi:hypothetical protein
MAEKDGALYVSAVEGHHVTRYGSTTLIGCEIDLGHPGNIRWNEEAIVAIPWGEYLTYKQEYDRLLADKALIEKSKEQYDAFLKARDAAIEAAAAAQAQTVDESRKVGVPRGRAAKIEES